MSLGRSRRRKMNRRRLKARKKLSPHDLRNYLLNKPQNDLRDLLVNLRKGDLRSMLNTCIAGKRKVTKRTPYNQGHVSPEEGYVGEGEDFGEKDRRYDLNGNDELIDEDELLGGEDDFNCDSSLSMSPTPPFATHDDGHEFKLEELSFC